MKKVGFFKLGLALTLAATSFNLTACSGRVPAPNQIAAAPATFTPAQDNFDQQYDDTQYQDDGYGQDFGGQSSLQAIPNTSAGSFKVDQDLSNQWRAKGIDVKNGSIYLSASDTSGLFKKGTVIRMNATDGKEWKNIGKKWLGTRHPMDSTIEGLTVANGTVIAVDSSSKVYTVDGSGKITVKEESGGKDVASAGNGSVFISNGLVERSDATASSRVPVQGLNATGGIDADRFGNVYAVAGIGIKKATIDGNIEDIIMENIAGAIDVAVDDREGFGDIYVLEQAQIKRFDANGQFVVAFPSGASKPVGISIDETGSIYVADNGQTHKDSQVLKFSAATNGIGSQGGMGGYGGANTGYDSYGADAGYDSYGGSNTGGFDTYNSASTNRFPSY